MRKSPVLCAVLLIATLGCKQSETVNTTSSSETTSTVAETTATAATTAPLTDTTAVTGSMSTDTTGTSSSSTAVTATTVPVVKPSTSTEKRKNSGGPVVTETVTQSGAENLPKNPPPPPIASSSPEPKASAPAESKPAASASNASLVTTGQGIFKAQCTACHGTDASGNTPVGKKNNIPDFRSAAVQGMSDAEIANVIANGKGPLSASAHKSKHLSADQISALVAYIRSLK